MNKKGRFEQFRSLIHNCEFGLGEKETTCMDLQVGMLFYPYFLIIWILDVSGYVKKLSGYPRIDE